MQANTGGRVTFQIGSEVRILCPDGKVSTEVYIIESEKSDRKGHVILKDKGTAKQVKVQYRRILPVFVDNNAVVIESGGKYRAVCPKCNYVEVVAGVSDYLTCPSHGQFQLYWLGVKPMTEATEKKVDGTKKEKSVSEKKERAPRVVRQPITVDINDMAGHAHCEVWTRKDVKFDHERVAVQAHTLLFTGSHPRKFCFNTYNGTLGKRSEPLPIDEFIHDKAVKGAKKEKPWYPVADLDKERSKLQKSGYELHTKK